MKGRNGGQLRGKSNLITLRDALLTLQRREFYSSPVNTDFDKMRKAQKRRELKALKRLEAALKSGQVVNRIQK